MIRSSKRVHKTENQQHFVADLFVCSKLAFVHNFFRKFVESVIWPVFYKHLCFFDIHIPD